MQSQGGDGASRGLVRRGVVLLCAVDFRERSSRALRHALRLLAAGAGSELHVVHVVPEHMARQLDPSDVTDALAELVIELVPHELRGVDLSLVWTHVRVGALLSSLAVAVDDLGADVLLVGAAPPIEGHEDEQAVARAIAPCSLFVAGGPLSMHSHPRERRPCPDCARMRVPGSERLFCAAHQPDVAPARSLARIVAPAVPGLEHARLH